MSSRTSDRMEGQGRVVAESAQDHLGELFRDAPGFIAMLRAPDFTIELANEAYHDLVGRREIIGKPLFDVLRDARDQGFEALLRRVLDSGERFVGREMSVVLDRTPGAPPEQRFVNFVCAPIGKAGDGWSGIFVHGSDVTDEVFTRQMLEAANQQLQEQATELEAQAEEAQALTEELEQSNEQLQATLVEVEEAREAAATAERFTASILESISDPFVVLDAEWRYRFVNEPAARMIEPSRGLAPGKLIGANMWELYPDIAGTDFDHHMRRAASERTTVSFEAFYPRRGEWSLLQCYPLPSGGIAVQWRNITVRKRAEEANHYLSQASDILAQSLDYEKTLNELAHVVVPQLADWCGVDIVEGDGTLRQLAVAHVDPEKIRLARELNEKHPPDPAASTGTYNVLRTGQPEIYPDIPDELLIAGAVDDDHLRILRELGLKSAIAVPLTVHDRTLGVLTLVAAESGRRYTNADLTLAMELAHRAAIAVDNALQHQTALAARQEAEEANKAKAEFLTTMSHELRTPLNAIAGYVELLKMGLRGPLTAGQEEFLSRIQRSQRRLLALIQDVLNFAKLEAGRVEVATADVDLDTLIRDIEPLVLPQMEQAGLTFALTACSPPVRVRADPERAIQVLLNLLSNAIKFTPRGGFIYLECEAKGDAVSVTVRDTGPGIPADKLETIFTPFVQLQRDPRDGYAGTGLGLSISRDLAHAMSGELSVQSEVGRGSAFTLCLPRVE